MTTLFFAGIVCILVSIGDKEGLGSLFAVDSPARPTAIYLLMAEAFSLVVSLLLFSPASLSQFQRLGLLALGGIQMLTGVIFASGSVAVTVVPLWFLYRFYREASA